MRNLPRYSGKISGKITHDDRKNIFSPHLDSQVYQKSRSPKAYKIGTRRILALPVQGFSILRFQKFQIKIGPSELTTSLINLDNGKTIK